MSSFGERIYDLRNRSNMSQGALADKLNVSRQTVSKWENNMCLPEAEKLLQLSEIFSVSVDYILKGEADTQSSPEPVYIYVKDSENENTSKHNERIVRKYVGIVISIIGALLTLWMAMVGNWLFIIFTGALVLFGILFARDSEHPWLTVSWITYTLLIIALPFCTSISPIMIFDPVIYTEGYLAHLLWAWGIWIVLVILILCTVKAKRGYVFKSKNKTE